MDELTVQVEAAAADSTPEQRDAMAAALRTKVKDRVGVTIRVEVLDPHALERSLGKAKRISDQRPR
jgi:phenylacetate-CoA ligase